MLVPVKDDDAIMEFGKEVCVETGSRVDVIVTMSCEHIQDRQQLSI